jgi:hypothetical protein
MRCEHVQDRILEILMEGETELPVGIQPHLDQCPQCAAEMQRLRRGVEAARLLPQMAVEPPKGMKDSVMAAIAEGAPETDKAPAPAKAAQVQDPAPERREERESGRWSLRDLVHSLMLRPLPIAAAMAVLVIGTLGVWAGSRHFEVKSANAVVEQVQESHALSNLNALEDAEWVRETPMHRNAVAEAKLQLQRLAEAEDDPEEVARVIRGLEEKRLAEAFRAMASAAPAGADQDKRMASEVVMVLEDIQHDDQ